MRGQATQLAELLSAAEVAKRLGVHVYTLREWAREGYIPAYKVGKGYRFDADTVDRWLESRLIHPAAQGQDDRDEQLAL